MIPELETERMWLRPVRLEDAGKMHRQAPFEDLEHGPSGITEDLRLLLGLKRESEVLPFVMLVAMRKRHANKERCPCDSGNRVGRCHHRLANRLRSRLGTYWFRVVEQQLVNSVPSGKSSDVRVRLTEWAEERVSRSRSRETPRRDQSMSPVSLQPAEANR